MFGRGDNQLAAIAKMILGRLLSSSSSTRRLAVILAIVSIFWLPGVRAQDSLSAQEIPIQRCDGLPVIKVRINRTDMFFLLDTASTTILNLRSFPSGRAKPIPVTTWTGNSTANGREVILPEVMVGNHEFRDLKLPAVDLSTIEKACGNRIDGILGFDLLDKIGMTIDLKRQVASFDMSTADVQGEFAEMEKAMHPCNEAFNLGKVDALKNCLDPAVILYTPAGEFRGREEVMDYLQRRYLRFAPKVRFEMTPRDMRSFGDALWYSYDFTIESPIEHAGGHGMAMCCRTGGQWHIVNMHNSLLQTGTTPKP